MNKEMIKAGNPDKAMILIKYDSKTRM